MSAEHGAPVVTMTMGFNDDSEARESMNKETVDVEMRRDIISNHANTIIEGKNTNLQHKTPL